MTTAASVIGSAPDGLPEPQRSGGMPLFTTLSLRQSGRAFSDRRLSHQTLSNLLWCAYGINRHNGDRTAPYWRHVMVIDVYVVAEEGVSVYLPHQHSVQPLLAGDRRADTGLQDFVARAPINLVYVAHGERMPELTAAEKRLYASVDAAFIGQNVYLFCAAEGLTTVFRGAVDHARLAHALRLQAHEFVTFAQTVGYPAGQ